MLFKSIMEVARPEAELAKETLIERPLSCNFVEADRELFDSELKQLIPSSNLYQIQNAKIQSFRRISDGIFYSGATLIKENFPHTRYPKTKNILRGALNLLRKSGQATRLEQGAWITEFWSHNYFHWTTEAVVKLFLLQQYKKDIQLILPAWDPKPAYLEEMLAPFKLPSQPIYLKPEEVMNVEVLDVPQLGPLTGHFDEQSIRSVGQLYRDYYGTGRTAHRKIYISRSKATARHIINEDEVLPILTKHGFEIVHFEDLAFSQQVEIMSECAVLAGPHGAGFVNMMFMPPGGKVVEIHPKDNKLVNCFFILAAACLHSHYYILANTVTENRKSHLDNIRVDTKQLEKTLNLL